MLSSVTSQAKDFWWHWRGSAPRRATSTILMTIGVFVAVGMAIGQLLLIEATCFALASAAVDELWLWWRRRRGQVARDVGVPG